MACVLRLLLRLVRLSALDARHPPRTASDQSPSRKSGHRLSRHDDLCSYVHRLGLRPSWSPPNVHLASYFGFTAGNGVGLAHSYTTFLLFRLAIGAIGASFVITQYHTSVMFAPNVVGTANAAAAGWGNLGGGVTQMVMPLLFAGFSSLAGAQWGWRLAMTVPGIAMFLLGIAYYMLTQDTPAGDFKDLGKRPSRDATYSTFAAACRDPRVWALSVIYGACFGMELTIDNIAALYFTDYFHLGLSLAGLVAGSFGAMNLFARALGGIVSDRCQRLWGLRGRTLLLGS